MLEKSQLKLFPRLSLLTTFSTLWLVQSCVQKFLYEPHLGGEDNEFSSYYTSLNELFLMFTKERECAHSKSQN